MKILVIEDDRNFRELLVEHLRERGYEVEGAGDREEGFEALEERDYPLVILNLFLSDGNGMDILRWIKENAPLTEVIVITGHGTIKTTVEAMKLGAYDFLTKPCSPREVEMLVSKALESRGLKRENLLLRKEKKPTWTTEATCSRVRL